MRFAFVALSLVMAAVAQAQTFPSRPIRVVVANSAGSAVDVVARTVMPRVSQQLGQPVVIENVASSAGVQGADQVARAAKDGYTIGMVSSNHVVNASVMKKLPYDAVRDFTPLSILGVAPLALVVTPDFPAKNVAELVAMAKAKPGAITFGSSGTGSIPHLAGEMLKSLAGIDLLHVPYKGIAQMITDIQSGQVQLGFPAVAISMPHVKAGRLRALAVAGAKRSPAAPDLPTIAESGVPGYQLDAWIGAMGPAGLPSEVTARLSTEIGRALQTPEVRERLQGIGIDVVASSAAEAQRTFENDVAMFARVVEAAGIQSE